MAGVGFALQTEVWIADIQENFYGNEFFLFWHKTILNLIQKAHGSSRSEAGANPTIKTEQR
jgi:hypothetical protein